MAAGAAFFFFFLFFYAVTPGLTIARTILIPLLAFSATRCSGKSETQEAADADVTAAVTDLAAAAKNFNPPNLNFRIQLFRGHHEVDCQLLRGILCPSLVSIVGIIHNVDLHQILAPIGVAIYVLHTMIA